MQIQIKLKTSFKLLKKASKVLKISLNLLKRIAHWFDIPPHAWEQTRESEREKKPKHISQDIESSLHNMPSKMKNIPLTNHTISALWLSSTRFLWWLMRASSTAFFLRNDFHSSSGWMWIEGVMDTEADTSAFAIFSSRF